MGFFSLHPPCGQPSCPSLARVTMGDSLTSSPQHQACGWSDHEVQRYGTVTRKNTERGAEVRRRCRDRETEKCQTEAGGQRGGDSEMGPVGGNTKRKETDRGEGGWRRGKMRQREGEKQERKGEKESRVKGGDWVRKVEERYGSQSRPQTWELGKLT